MPASSSIDPSRVAELFHALSDETRLGVLDMLRGGEQCVCDLQGRFDAAQSRLSYHLKVLKAAGLVVDRQEGRWSYYSVVPAAMHEAHDAIRVLASGIGTSVDDRASRSAGKGPTTLKVLGACCT
jgi:ArsR family transcriptional regulator